MGKDLSNTLFSKEKFIAVRVVKVPLTTKSGTVFISNAVLCFLSRGRIDKSIRFNLYGYFLCLSHC